MYQGNVGLQDDALVAVAGRDLDVEGFCALVGQLAGDDDLGAVKIIAEEMLSDVLDRVLGVVDPYVGEQRSSYLVVEPKETRQGYRIKSKYLGTFLKN